MKGLLRAKRWSSASSVKELVVCRKGSVGWIWGIAWRNGRQSLARFLSLARVMAKAHLLAFEGLHFEEFHSPQALAVAVMLPPPVASTGH